MLQHMSNSIQRLWEDSKQYAVVNKIQNNYSVIKISFLKPYTFPLLK